MISLSLPLPPSKNDIHELGLRFTKQGKPYRGVRATAAYNAFRYQVNQAVAAQTTADQIQALQGKRLMLAVQVRFPDNGRRRDAANIVDSLLDALKVPLAVDDEHFWILDLRRHEEPGLPECCVLIGEVE